MTTPPSDDGREETPAQSPRASDYSDDFAPARRRLHAGAAHGRGPRRQGADYRFVGGRPRRHRHLQRPRKLGGGRGTARRCSSASDAASSDHESHAPSRASPTLVSRRRLVLRGLLPHHGRPLDASARGALPSRGALPATTGLATRRVRRGDLRRHGRVVSGNNRRGGQRRRHLRGRLRRRRPRADASTPPWRVFLHGVMALLLNILRSASGSFDDDERLERRRGLRDDDELGVRHMGRRRRRAASAASSALEPRSALWVDRRRRSIPRTSPTTTPRGPSTRRRPSCSARSASVPALAGDRARRRRGRPPLLVLVRRSLHLGAAAAAPPPGRRRRGDGAPQTAPTPTPWRRSGARASRLPLRAPRRGPAACMWKGGSPRGAHRGRPRSVRRHVRGRAAARTAQDQGVARGAANDAATA